MTRLGNSICLSGVWRCRWSQISNKAINYTCIIYNNVNHCSPLWYKVISYARLQIWIQCDASLHINIKVRMQLICLYGLEKVELFHIPVGIHMCVCGRVCPEGQTNQFLLCVYTVFVQMSIWVCVYPCSLKWSLIPCWWTEAVSSWM